MRKSIAFILFFSLILSCGPAVAADWWQESAPSYDAVDQKTVVKPKKPMTFKSKTGVSPVLNAVRVNWVDKYIEVVAGGTTVQEEAVNMAHAVSLAKKTARHLAYEKLAETVKGIKITSDATYDRELMVDANLRTKVDAFVKGAKVVDETVDELSDGSLWAEVRLGIHLMGPNSLMSKTTDWIEANPPQSVPPAGSTIKPKDVTPKPAKASGVIIDARGLGLRPAMVPKIMAKNGEVLYGSQDVSREYLTKFGLVGYAPSVENAEGLKRTGKTPLVLKGLSAGDGDNCDVMLSDVDAAKLRELGNGKALKDCRVVFVIN